jgi:thiamine pyrophosphate-dependent acetolactate synthase large subunit-like protein
MKTADAVAQILKAEGTEILVAYPNNDVIEAAAKVDIRTVIVRQERTGIHMADAISRVTSGQHVGVFASQHGPGTENSFGGVAQAYGDSSPIVVLAAGHPRPHTNVPPYFNAFLNYQHITKSCEQVTLPDVAPDAMRRAFSQVKNGRPRPVLVELPKDIMGAELTAPFVYAPVTRARSAPDPQAVVEVAEALVAAERPVILAGQGVHYAQAWEALRELAELLGAPVTSTLEGKSAFPENHPLSLGAGSRAIPLPVRHFLDNADLIFGIGCSFAYTRYGVQLPKQGPTYIQATLDPDDLNRDLPVDHALVGDAELTLRALLAEVGERVAGDTEGSRRERAEQVTDKIAGLRDRWLGEWNHKLTSVDTPISPYRVIWDMLNTVDVDNTIITHDAGSPRDQLAPFWRCTAPLGYLGWGKTTQLGYGLGLAMGAKLARPEKLCINVWGDAAIGMTGMDFETAARENIPILSILFNNFAMTIEIKNYPVATEKYRATDITGNYADMARAFGGYGERVTDPKEVIPALKRGIAQTQDGRPALLEFITEKETELSFIEEAGGA